MINNEIVTCSEFEAFLLVYGGFTNTKQGIREIRAAAQRIIELAERIKSERAVITMNLAANNGILHSDPARL